MTFPGFLSPPWRKRAVNECLSNESQRKVVRVTLSLTLPAVQMLQSKDGSRALRGLAVTMTLDREKVVAQAKAERRRFLRVRVDLPGRLFIPAESREERCKI